MRVFIISLFLAFQSSTSERTSFEYGRYKVVGKKIPICTDGLVTLVGDNQNPTLQIGARISLGPLNSQKVVEKSEDDCSFTRIIEHKKDSIVQTTLVEACPQNKKNLEQNVIQSLRKKGSALLYEILKNGKKESCLFEKWVKK